MNDQLNQLEQSILQQDSDTGNQAGRTLGERHPAVYLGLMILFASMVFFAGAMMLPRTREKYLNKEITTEQVEKERNTRHDAYNVNG